MDPINKPKIPGIFPGLRARAVAKMAVATAVLAVGVAVTAPAHANSYNMGYLSYDVGVSGPSSANFDITNLTGPNDAPPDFPVTTSVSFTNLSLTVDFSDGSSKVFGQADFALGPDGLSYQGPEVALGGSVDPVEAILTGTFSPTSISLADGTSDTIGDSFTATVTDVSGGPLNDGDLALIVSTTSTGGGTSVPEPGSLALLAGGLFAFWQFQRRRPQAWATAGLAAILALLFGTAPAFASPPIAVKLATETTSFTGVSGVSFLNLTASGLPSDAVASTMKVAVAPTCPIPSGVSGEADTNSTGITTIVGSTKRVRFEVPAGLAKGTYYVAISGTGSSGDTYASTNCSIMLVTTTNSTLAACIPTSSLAVALGTTVTAFVPNGAWCCGTTGVQAVPIEGGGSPVSISTADRINSCSSNPATGETVCTANNTHVYILTGTTVTSMLSTSSTRTAGFSGGSCNNCGVAINALTNMAYIAGGFSPGDGIQALNLVSNAFSTPFAMTRLVSENISIDPTRNLILSPGEDNSYTLLSLNAGGTITGEFDDPISAGGEFDSAAEDCTTGIALTSQEFTNNIVLTDLTQGVFTPGTPGTWTAPNQSVYVGSDAGGSFAAGTDGISVAPGSGHMGIVTGEFGGNTASAFLLPSTSGSGTPALVDYAYFVLPTTPDGRGFSAGFDPHTTTAYTSPNDGKAYAVIADWSPGTPSYLAVIDLAALLAAPRTATHTVDTSYDLVAHGVIRYVATH